MNYRNAKYIDDVRIDCEIEHARFGWIPYTLDPSDEDQTVNNDELLAAMLENGDVEAYVPPTQEELYAIEAERVRTIRNDKLSSEVDPVVSNPLRWNELTTEEQTAWADYRRALLDITDQEGFPHDITWAAKPL